VVFFAYGKLGGITGNALVPYLGMGAFFIIIIIAMIRT
jgi:hypothetical protein